MPYWIVIDGKSLLPGNPPKSRRFGPFVSEEEAEQAKVNHLPWDDDGYIYHVHIEAEASPLTESDRERLRGDPSD